MPCAGTCGKCLLIFFNVMFFLIGAALVTAGILMKTNFDVLDDTEVLKLLDKIVLSSSSIGIGTLIVNLSTVIIVLGGGLVIVTILAICGVCAKNQCLLTTYAVVTIILCLATVGAFVIFLEYRGEIDYRLENKLKELLEDYKGEGGTDDVSVGWNYLFIGYECCGVNAITATNDEFVKATQWARGSKKIPYSCCKSATEDNYKGTAETACTDSLTTTLYHTKGCYDQVVDWVNRYELWVLISFGALIAFQILAIIFAFLICCELHYDGIRKVGHW